MKKIWFILLGLLSMIVTSCGGTYTPKETVNTQEVPANSISTPVEITQTTPESKLNSQSLISNFFKAIAKQATKQTI